MGPTYAGFYNHLLWNINWNGAQVIIFLSFITEDFFRTPAQALYHLADGLL